MFAHHCLVGFQVNPEAAIPQIYWGVCLPKNCSAIDVSAALREIPGDIGSIVDEIKILPNDSFSLILKGFVPVLEELETDLLPYLNNQSVKVHCR